MNKWIANREEIINYNVKNDLIPTSDDPIESKRNRYYISTVFTDPQVRIVKTSKDKTNYYIQTVHAGIKYAKNILKEYFSEKKTYYLNFDKPETYTLYYTAYQELYKVNGPKIVSYPQKQIELLDKAEILKTIKAYHKEKTNHRGITPTISALQRTFYFENMKKRVTEYINQCEICDKNKYDRQPPKVPVTLTETASAPFDIIHANTYTYFIAIIDAFSKMVQAYPASINMA